MNGLYPPIVETGPRGGGSANSLFYLATEERPLVGKTGLKGGFSSRCVTGGYIRDQGGAPPVNLRRFTGGLPLPLRPRTF